MTNPDPIPAQIEAARKKIPGLTQEAAAKAAGIASRFEWSNIVSGRQKASQDRLDAMARAVGCRIERTAVLVSEG